MVIMMIEIRDGMGIWNWDWDKDEDINEIVDGDWDGRYAWWLGLREGLGLLWDFEYGLLTRWLGLGLAYGFGQKLKQIGYQLGFILRLRLKITLEILFGLVDGCEVRESTIYILYLI